MLKTGMIEPKEVNGTSTPGPAEEEVDCVGLKRIV
jgi:hypothetical protein